MGRVVRFAAAEQVELVDYDEAPLAAGEVRLATRYSGISAGTELTAYRGTNPFVSKRWDEARGLFVEGAEASLRYPFVGWAYEEVGEIVELGDGVTQVALGDVVYGNWGHRSTHVATEVWVAERKLPTGLDPLLGIFARIGAIALNAVFDAEARIGEQIAVFGQGVPGLIATQLVRHAGAEAIAVDGIPARLELARRLGATEVLDFTAVSPAERIKSLTGGRGADAAIEITGSPRALHEAIRSVAYNARVACSGFQQGEAVGLYLGEEFHHNRVQLICSQIDGVAPAIAGRWSLPRLEHTVLRLAAAGALDLHPLISDIVPAAEAASAFARLAHAPGDAVQVVLDFTDGRNTSTPNSGEAISEEGAVHAQSREP